VVIPRPIRSLGVASELKAAAAHNGDYPRPYPGSESLGYSSQSAAKLLHLAIIGGPEVDRLGRGRVESVARTPKMHDEQQGGLGGRRDDFFNEGRNFSQGRR
jgi:hypothetical protein